MSICYKRVRVAVSDREIDDERMKEPGVSKEEAISRVIRRLALRGGVRASFCSHVNSGRFGDIYEVAGTPVPRHLEPRKFSRSVLIRQRMNRIAVVTPTIKTGTKSDVQ